MHAASSAARSSPWHGDFESALVDDCTVRLTHTRVAVADSPSLTWRLRATPVRENQVGLTQQRVALAGEGGAADPGRV